MSMNFNKAMKSWCLKEILLYRCILKLLLLLKKFLILFSLMHIILYWYFVCIEWSPRGIPRAPVDAACIIYFESWDLIGWWNQMEWIEWWEHGCDWLMQWRMAGVSGACVTKATWGIQKFLANCSGAFKWKLCCHWLQGLRQHQDRFSETSHLLSELTLFSHFHLSLCVKGAFIYYVTVFRDHSVFSDVTVGMLLFVICNKIMSCI